MPNHFHLLITPSETTSLEKAVQLIKGGFSREFHKQRENRIEIWQVGFHDWTIRDAEDYWAKVRYIHLNPVEARLVDRHTAGLKPGPPKSKVSGRESLGGPRSCVEIEAKEMSRSQGNG